MNTPMKVLVVGATGGSGRAAVERLLSQGHQVTAFARSATNLDLRSSQLRTIDGDALSPTDLLPAVEGQDAVIVTLGISENPLWVRLFGARRTARNFRSAGTRRVIEAMRHHGVRRLVVQTSFGLQETHAALRFRERLIFRLLLHPQLVDTQIQQNIVYESGLDWVIAQPVNLTDGPANTAPYLSISGQVRNWRVARKRVARFLSDAIQGREFLCQSVAISG